MAEKDTSFGHNARKREWTGENCYGKFPFP